MAARHERDLFGGAIKGVLPVNLTDASLVREVPDTQEVFIYPDFNVSIIVEVLQRVEPEEDTEAIKFHFNSLAHDNDALESRISKIETVQHRHGSAESTPVPTVLEGAQMVQKFNKEAIDEVLIILAMYRIVDKKVDLIVSINIPTKAEEGAVEEQGRQQVTADFLEFIQTLRIVDFGLFA